MDLAGLIAGSPSLGTTLEGAERAARSSAPILILGEAGSGRSSLARALHGAGERAAEPLVEVDAAALPGSLVESELFGYRRGAFTGADRSAEGRVARAEGGSLLLDQVEEIPLDVQPKMLRLLSEGTYAPLGGSEQNANVRYLAIGPVDLVDRVERGRFRRDLFHRLEVLTFALPPLRARRDDLATLAAALIADLAARFGVEPPALSESALAWMSDYDWPGNVRQLRNVLERELVLGDSLEIDPEPPRDREVVPRTLLEMEKEAILRALAYTRGKQGKAAELLGISRKALWAKRKRYGIR